MCQNAWKNRPTTLGLDEGLVCSCPQKMGNGTSTAEIGDEGTTPTPTSPIASRALMVDTENVPAVSSFEEKRPQALDLVKHKLSRLGRRLSNSFSPISKGSKYQDEDGNLFILISNFSKRNLTQKNNQGKSHQAPTHPLPF